MADMLDLSVKEFVAATAARHPTPGGGSVAALCGALAAALGAMAVEYSLGKKAFAAHEAELQAALAHFHTASDMLQRLVAEDVAAYEALGPLLKLPPEQRLAHPDYAAAVVAAIRAPQAVAGFALNILEHCAGLLDKTSKHLLSDLGMAATYAHATVLGSELNVRVNLGLLPNPQEAAALRQSIHELSDKADALFAAIRKELLARM